METEGILLPNSHNQLFATTNDIFGRGTLDIDELLTGELGISTGQLSANLGITDVILFYELFDIDALIELSLSQTLQLTGELPTVLSVNGGPEIPFLLGDTIEIIVPDDGSTRLDIMANIDFDALFENRTDLGLNFELDVLAGDFGLDLESIWGSQSFEIGPLVQESFDVENASFTVFDSSFTLEGFAPQQVSFSIPIAMAESKTSSETALAVPEPSILFRLGLFGLWGIKQKRKTVNRHL